MRTTRLLPLAFVVMLALGSLATASVPPMINYQGKLMQPNGTPVPDGEYKMAFAIYGQPTVGTALWSEVNEHVQVKGGLYSVLLGSVINLPANIFDTPDRWFGFKVGDDPEMSPRQRIASVGFAIKAASADLAATVPDGAITTAKLLDQSVTAVKLADGSVTTAKVAAGAVDSSKIAVGAVTTDNIANRAVDYSKLSAGILVNRWYVPWFGQAGEACFSTNSQSFATFGKLLQSGGVTGIPAAPGLTRRFRLAVSCSDNQSSGGSYYRIVGNGQTVAEYFVPARYGDANITNSYHSPVFDSADRSHWQLQARATGGTVWVHSVQLVVEDYL